MHVPTKKVLDWVREFGSEVYTADYVVHFETNATTASMRLKRLTEAGYLDRYQTEDGRFAYVITGTPPPKFIEREDKKEVVPLSSEQIFSFLKAWSENKWSPKIFQVAENLPKGIATLYVESITGSTPNPVVLSEVRQMWKTLKDALQQTTYVVECFIATRHLFDEDDVSDYLVGDRNPEELIQYIKNLLAHYEG